MARRVARHAVEPVDLHAHLTRWEQRLGRASDSGRPVGVAQ